MNYINEMLEAVRQGCEMTACMIIQIAVDEGAYEPTLDMLYMMRENMDVHEDVVYT